MYVSHEFCGATIKSFDVLLVQMSDFERHMAARYIIKWKPCVDTRKRVVKRDSTGSRYMGSSYCKHYFFSRRKLFNRNIT